MDHSQTVSIDDPKITAVVQNLMNEGNVISCKRNGGHIDKTLHKNVNIDDNTLSSSSKNDFVQSENVHFPLAEQDNVRNSKKAQYDGHERITLKRKLSRSDDTPSPDQKHIRFDQCRNIENYTSISSKVINSIDSESSADDNEESQSSNNLQDGESQDYSTSFPVDDFVEGDNMLPLSNSNESMNNIQLELSSQRSGSKCSNEIDNQYQDSNSQNQLHTNKNDDSPLEFEHSEFHKDKIKKDENLCSLIFGRKSSFRRSNDENSTKIPGLLSSPYNRSRSSSRLSFEDETYNEYDQPIRLSSYSEDKEEVDDNERIPQRLSQTACNENDISDEDEEYENEGENEKESINENKNPQHLLKYLLTKEEDEQGVEEVHDKSLSINEAHVNSKVSESVKVPIRLVNYDYNDLSMSQASDDSVNGAGSIAGNETEIEDDKKSVRSQSESGTSSQSSSRSSSSSRSKSRSRSRSRPKSRSSAKSESSNSNFNKIGSISADMGDDNIDKQHPEVSPLNNNNETGNEEDSGTTNRSASQIDQDEAIENSIEAMSQNSYSNMNNSSSNIDENQSQDVDSRLSVPKDSENSNSGLSNRINDEETNTSSDKGDEILPVVASCSKDEFLRILEKSIDKNCDSSRSSSNSDESIVERHECPVENQSKSDKLSQMSISDAEYTSTLDLSIDLNTNKTNTINPIQDNKECNYDDDDNDSGPIDFSKVKSSIELAFPERIENPLSNYQYSPSTTQPNQKTNNLMFFEMQCSEIDKLAFPVSTNEIESKIDALNLTMMNETFGNKNANDPPDIGISDHSSSAQSHKSQNTCSTNKERLNYENLVSDNSNTVPILENTNKSAVDQNGIDNVVSTYQEEQLYNFSEPNDYFAKSGQPNKNVYHCFKCDNISFKTLYELRNHQNVCHTKKSANNQPTMNSEQFNKVDKPMSLLQQKLQQPLITPNSSQTQTRLQEQQKPPQPPVQTFNEQTVNMEENRVTKKDAFFCSACKTYYDGWNLFLHMREVHNRHICLYCVRIFPTGEKLTLHLELKHDLEQNHYISHERLLKSSSDTTFVMCCNCELVFSEQENFVDHICAEIIKPCSLCGNKGAHSLNCKGITKEEKKSRLKLKEKGKKNLTKKPIFEEIAKVSSNPQQLNEITDVVQQHQQQQFHHQQQHQQQQQHHNQQQQQLQQILQQHQQQPLKINGWPSINSENIFNTNQPIIQNNSKNLLAQSEMFDKPPLPPQPSSALLDIFSTYDESNSSDQMVIDETCNNNNITYNNTESLMLNAFKNLNKTETNYIQHSNRPNERPLPVGGYGQGKKISADDAPDMNDLDMDEQQSTSVSDNNQQDFDIIPNTEEQLIVPKFKLRIPKQYQKSIHSDASSLASSETDEDNADNDNECEREEQIENRNANNQVVNDSNFMQQDNTKEPEPITDGNDTMDIESNDCSNQMEKQELENNATRSNEIGMETNPKLDSSFERSINDFERIQREIEKTKMDIERTKMSFQNPTNVEPIEQSSEVQINEESNEPNDIIKLLHNVNETTIEKTEENESSHTTTIGDLNLDELSLPLPSQESSLQTPPQPSPVSLMPMLLNGDNYQNIENKQTNNEQSNEIQQIADTEVEEEQNSDGIILANNEVRPVDLFLDRPLEQISAVEFLRICVKTVFPLCLYCNHARRIAVNGNSLVLHLLAEHRFSATVDSITAEELLPSTIVSRLKSFLTELENSYFNLESYCKVDGMDSTSIIEERIFECYSCRFQTRVHKDLYLHNRKMHMKSAILCIMCRSNFFSYSEILCHKCPGIPNKTSVFDIQFRCCLCEVDNIPSAFRLMVHLRKKHCACDICLEDCQDQSRLASHVWKHKLHHVCFRCGIGYRNKPDITKHLFWKHGTESIICKRCLQKRWRHVYHFCTPAPSFVCDICNVCFSKANILRVHKRLHTEEVPHNCPHENCERKFISKKLLNKHVGEHTPAIEAKPEEPENVEMKTAIEEENLQKENAGSDATLNNVKVEEVKVDETRDEHISPTEKDETSVSKVNENVDESNVVDKSGVGMNRKKKKTHKKSVKERIDDLNLQAPNLSESDSSEESDTEKSKLDEIVSLSKSGMVSPQSNDERIDETLEDNEKIIDIWANFKSYQESQKKSGNEDVNMNENSNDYLEKKILHVSQSDHDYCLMFKSIVKQNFETIYTEIKNLDFSGSSHNSQENKDSDNEISNKKRSISKSPRKKQKSPRKRNRSGSDSSSSESSTSSCSCGSNCSCSSSDSNNSSSSSSSDDDSDSSNSVSRKKLIKKQTDAETPNKAKDESDAVTMPVLKKLNEILNAENSNAQNEKQKESIIYESDLETSETDTDEDFYDDHPQKLAAQQLDEKRRQLMARASLSPYHHGDILVNSRPSTPSLPDETVKEKKVKIKKKKHDRKVSKTFLSSTAKLHEHHAMPQSDMIPPHNPLVHPTEIFSTKIDPVPPFNLIAYPGAPELFQHTTTPLSHNVIHSIHPISKLSAAPISQHNRMSTGSSCSDADASLKRSKRARRPNKFYGYTSDDELMQPTTKIMGGQLGHFKPTPPPPLTWCKEDLPSPSKSAAKLRTPKQPRNPKKLKTGSSSGNSLKKNILNRERSLHARIRNKEMKKMAGIPTLKIRPLPVPSVTNVHNQDFIQQSPLEQFTPPAAIIDAMQLPPTSMNNTEQPTMYPAQEESSGSDSSDDNNENFNLLLPLPEFIHGKSHLSSLPPKKLWASQRTYFPEPTPQPQLQTHLQPQPQPQPQTPIQPPPAPVPLALLPNPDAAAIQYFKRNNIRYPIQAPAGARPPRDGESVYCYCRCPYDEVSEMIACDGSNCAIEWFHFECVGIMLAPQGKWYCAECRPQYSSELYPI